MNSGCPDACSSLIEKLEKKLHEFAKYRRRFIWRFFQGESPQAYKASFDDSSWRKVDLPITFDARKGDGWFRCKVTVPEEINGIDVSGSIVKMFSFPLLGKTEVFVNSRKVLSADYWTEFRGPRIILSKNAQPMDEYVIAVHVFQKYEPVTVPAFEIRFQKVEGFIFEIESFMQELRLARILDERTANIVSQKFDEKIIEEDLSSLIEEIRKARTQMANLKKEAKKFKVHLVAHAHIDMNWLWPWKDTVATVKDTFSTMLRFMDEYPDFCFSQSQAAVYKIVEEKFPEMFESIKKRANEKRWDITASMWVEADLNMTGNEALIRQFLEAKEYIKEKFGFEPEVCWEPDTFGHVWTLPQIIRKTGGRYYYFMRCGKGEPIFWWKSPDGSRVLAFTSIYNNFVTPKNIVDLVIDLYERYGLKTSMFVYGVGNHGGGATVEDIEAAVKIQEKDLLPDVFFSTTHNFFRDVQNELDGKRIPVINDELQFIFDGCYTTHSDIKRYNRLCERLLVDAEKFSVFSGNYPHDSIKKAWRNMLFNQFHDILDGSGTSEAYLYPKELAEESIKIARDVLDSSIQRIANRIRFSRSEIAIVVFNSLSWDRVDIVKVRIPSEKVPSKPVLISADGQEKVKAQFDGEELIFVANVPSMGYRTYYLVDGKEECENSSALKCNNDSIENEYFKLEVDKDSGTISSLLDKTEQRFVFKKDRLPQTKPIFSNLFQVLYELPHPMSAWVIGEIVRTENLIKGATVELIENGPVRATIKVVHKLLNSKITQHISLYERIPRVDFNTIIDWRETSDDHTEAPMLKVSFTPMLRNSKVTYEIPFGYIERPADGTEVPALKWIDISDDEYGVSLLNDCKYGFDAQGNTIRMTLVRTSYSPDPKPDVGVHRVKYSLYPHIGSWKESLTFQRGYEINHPLEALVIMDPSVIRGSKPERFSFLRVEPKNVIVSCVKAAEDSKGLIVRIYDATGDGADAELNFGFKIQEAYESDLLERIIKPLHRTQRKVRVHLSPFEVKTIRIKGKLWKAAF